MVKRLKDIAAASADSNLADTVRDSAQQIWLAGLGAFSKAQEEGVKVFDALVKEGKGLEAKTRKLTGERMGDVTEQMSKAAQNATSKANAAWDKLEQVFEDRVARSLNRLGVPTNKDIQSLSKQVAELSATVKALRARQPNAAKAPAKKAAARRKAG
jgi:poly(hydroxyalkanoate) granule-associated protein